MARSTVRTSTADELTAIAHEMALASEAFATQQTDWIGNGIALARSIWRSYPLRLAKINAIAKRLGPRLGDIFGSQVDWTESARRNAVAELNKAHVAATRFLEHWANEIGNDGNAIAVSGNYCRLIFEGGLFPDVFRSHEDAYWWPACLKLASFPQNPTLFATSVAANELVDRLWEGRSSLASQAEPSGPAHDQKRGLRPSDAERTKAVLSIINELGKDPKGHHASVKKIIATLTASGNGQRPQTTRQILRTLKDQGKYNGRN